MLGLGIRAMNEILKRFLKIRPIMVPFVKAYIRYFPIDASKRPVWKLLAPFLEFASHEFAASTFFQAYMTGNTHDIIDRYIYYFGVWEPNLTAFIGRRLAPGDVFVDIGANTGYYTLWGARLVGAEGSVIAVEASPTIFQILNNHLVQNGVTNVRAVNVAASNRPGKVRLYRGPEWNRGGSTIIGDDLSLLEGEVPALPLQTILQPEEVRRTRFVKIDVEGAEWLVAEGMAPLFAYGRKDLEVVIEVSPKCLAAVGHSANEIVDLFDAAGFHTYELSNDYSFESYLPPRTVSSPIRVRGPIHKQTDIVFSRIDAEEL